MKKPAYKMLLNILLLSFINITTVSEHSFSQSLHRARIYGKVTDGSTKEPLYFVNVFLSNTTLGCATDQDGVFILENIPPGKYNLVVSMIGYGLHIEEVKLKGRESYEYAIKLQPNAIEFSGRMGNDRMAAELPWDYVPASPEANGLSLSPKNVDYYLKGMEYLKTGDWEQALKTWWSGWSALEMADKTDPRIGIAFIELATENRAEKYYGTASELYVWGFSNDDYMEFKEVVIKEADRIIPLLNEEEAKAWKKRIKIKDPKLCRMIRLFWMERDPRPKTKANERLIEHWERIAHARKHFRMTRYSVYDCDDRGTIYVKYGEPGKKKSGSLGSSAVSEMELMRWEPNARARAQIKLTDPSPDYEVWAYGDIGTEKPSIFLFANRDGTGSFGLRRGIENLMKDKSYILQIMYYAELANWDRYFGDRYTDLEFVWARRERRNRPSSREFSSRLRSAFLTNRGEDRFNPTHKYADIDKSDYESLTGKINIKTHPVRTLNYQNQPKLSLLTSSSPQFRAEDMIQKTKNELEVPEYLLSHTLIVRDENLEETERKVDNLQGSPNNVTAFMLEHTPNHAHFILASEAYQVGVTEQDSTREVPSKVLAMGKEIVTVPTPLDTEPGELELSDLVLGIDVPADIELPPFPFSVIPTYEFAPQDPLKMAIEIYHLVLNDKAEAQYTIEYGVAQLDKKGRRRKQQISMAYSFVVQSRTAKEALSVDISKLKPGPYDFFVKVKDQVSRREKTRKVHFVVVE